MGSLLVTSSPWEWGGVGGWSGGGGGIEEGGERERDLKRGGEREGEMREKGEGGGHRGRREREERGRER